jgi:Fe-S cluster assembly iron-binding protein IscA
MIIIQTKQKNNHMDIVGLRVYVPFKGGSTHGFGTIRETTKEKDFGNIHKYVFENKTGTIYFNKLSDNQIRGIEILKKPEELWK